MRVVTWNVNSLKARMHRVTELLELHDPDVVLLQETKASPEHFPHLELQAAGYTAVDNSTGRWAGVAILARGDVDGVQIGLPGESASEEGRWVEATVDGVTFASVYVINGRALDDPMFPAKLDFLDAMCARLDELAQRGPTIVGGDFNIAPADEDVWHPPAFEGGTHVTVEERERLERMLACGYVDAYRTLEPEATGYTWWDYRAGHFHKNFGLRIDLFLVSHHLSEQIATCGIDRNFRKGPKPSDHAPLLMTLEP